MQSLSDGLPSVDRNLNHLEAGRHSTQHENDDDGQPFLFTTVSSALATSHSVDEIDRVLDSKQTPIPYNDTGDVWTFENVPKEAARRTSVIRTSFPCYGCTMGLWDSSFEPNVEQERAVSLDEHAVWPVTFAYIGFVRHTLSLSALSPLASRPAYVTNNPLPQ